MCESFRQPKSVLRILNHICLSLILLHWNVKWSSLGRLLEHLESSGSETMMRGPIVNQLREGRNREINILTESWR